MPFDKLIRLCRWFSQIITWSRSSANILCLVLTWIKRRISATQGFRRCTHADSACTCGRSERRAQVNSSERVAYATDASGSTSFPVLPDANCDSMGPTLPNTTQDEPELESRRDMISIVPVDDFVGEAIDSEMRANLTHLVQAKGNINCQQCVRYPLQNAAAPEPYLPIWTSYYRYNGRDPHVCVHVLLPTDGPYRFFTDTQKLPVRR